MASHTEGLRIRLRDEEPIDVCELVHRLESEDKKPLRSVLRGAELVFARREEPKPNGSLEKRRAFLRRRAEEREYDKLVASVRPKTVKPEDRVAASLQMTFTVSANMVVAPVGAFFVAFLASRTLVEKQSSRIAIGLGGAIAILFIEMILYIARAYTLETLKPKKIRAKRR
ncbi:hypothetical protein CTAYLR_007015 [Chrysophaeum taylorii]|uniref:Uncharacterized protein n=1 Tax=Chrysophaeum taylorii TaxID=2483200 RepID=A0AAD7U8L2_9STRA|nr:hypothetical protein CTAYLR_007015 [Chrysophaeum taylorii]